MEWQPIISCPTDGRPRPLRLPSGREIVGCFQGGAWVEVIEEIPRQDPDVETCGVKRGGARGTMRLIKPFPRDVFPTHWQPVEY